MDLKEVVLKLIQDAPVASLNIQKITRILNMQKTSDFVKINKILSGLENECIIYRDQKNFYLLSSASNQFKGIVKTNRFNRAFIEHEDGERYNIDEKNLLNALHLDEVLYELDVKRGKVKVIKILKPYRTFIIGTFHSGKNNRFFFDSDDNKVSKRLKIMNKLSFKPVNGLKAKVKILKIKEFIEVEVVEVIGHENDPSVDISAVLMEYQIPLTFDDRVMKQANDICQVINPKDYPDRINHIGLLTITIDGDDSKDFDDAISIEKIPAGYRLYVHIADVSHYVQENTPLDKEAYSRGTSTYVCDRVVPMLPHVLSNGICSLVPNEIRLTMTCEMDIDDKGEVLDYKIYNSMIKSDQRMTYKNVNRMIEQDKDALTTYSSLKTMVEDMMALSTIIRTKRFNEGAIDFEKDEAKLVMSNDGKVKEICLRERGDAEKLIEDFMIMANICVARQSKWVDIPSLYRVHETPKLKQLEQFIHIAYLFDYKFKGRIENITSKALQACLDHFKDEDEYLVIKTLLLRSMTRARYAEQCLGHYGLGLEEYSHFTSPIRRYPDLIVHRMLKKYVIAQDYDVKKMNKDQKKMKDYAEKTSLLERRSVEAERSVNDMKIAEYMQNHIGEIHEGIISSITSFGFFVELENTVEGLVHIRRLNQYFNFDEENLLLISEDGQTTYKIGQKVKIRVASASKQDRQIDFDIYQKRKRHQVWI